MELTALFFALLAGICTTLEANINSKLGAIITPKIATLHSLVTGAIIILIITLIKGTLSQYSKIIYVRPHLLIGGILGAVIIYLVIKAIPELGLVNTLTIIIASQILSGLLIDIFITNQHQLSFEKLLGVFLLISGTYLIVKQV